MIERFCYRMPLEISRPMYNEYSNRLKEITYIISNRPAYYSMENDRKTIELILALSIFYKRVIANINGATVFATTVFKHSDADAIRIGNYDLSLQEKNKILAVIISFNKLLLKYEISHDPITTTETKDLIRKIKSLKARLEKGEENNSNQNESI